MNIGGDAVFLSGQISGSQTSGLIKTGPGFLQIYGDEPNTYTGTTTVNQGQLILAKEWFVGIPAIVGPLVIGDAMGGPDVDKVVLANHDQILGSVLINSSGLLDLSDSSDQVALTMAGGHVRTNEGTLELTNTVTTQPSTFSSRINVDSPLGAVSLGFDPGFTTFNVADGVAVNDLVIDGKISGPAGRGLIKTGIGRMVLAGGVANMYTGATVVNGGTLVLNKSSTDAAIQGDLLIGTSGTETAIVELGLSFQIQESVNSEVTIGEFGVLNTNGFSDDIGPLVMRGGRVTGGGVVRVGFGVRSESSAQTALISSALDLNGSVQNLDIAGGTANPDLEIPGALVNGGINKTGVGTLLLRGVSTYSGPTTVNGGVLLVNNTAGSGTGIGNIAVNAGILGGNGSIAGSVSVAGVLAPGSSIGDLAVGAVAFGSGARFSVELGGLNAGTEYDQLIVAGDALLNGQLGVSLVGGFVPAQGDMFEVLTAGIVTGQFSILSMPAVANGASFTWQVHYSPGDVTLEVLSALLGDYNDNGVVDAPDYVVWRNTLGNPHRVSPPTAMAMA